MGPRKVEKNLNPILVFLVFLELPSPLLIMTTTKLSNSEVDSFDYLIIGGGTAGCVLASRLAEYLPKKRILLIEAGPSDFMNDKVLKLKDWLNLLGGELDYDYGTTEQPNGKYMALCLRFGHPLHLLHVYCTGNGRM